MMKTLLTLFTLFCLRFVAFSQTTTTLLRDTISSSRVKFTVSLQGGLNDLETVKVLLYQTNEADTLLISESLYSVAENDPIAFYSLKKTENGYEFGLGVYQLETYRCKLYLKRENSAEEEINLN